ncbi:hypothetical protein ACOREI_000001 [Yersinia enterocolitica]|nr:hypothetical protein [Yersinia enterocolitica]
MKIRKIAPESDVSSGALGKLAAGGCFHIGHEVGQLREHFCGL